MTAVDEREYNRAVFDQMRRAAENSQPVQVPRRLRGLRFPVIPTGSWLAQVGGGIAALSGVFMQWGTPAALMVGGASAVLVSALKEAGLLDAPKEGGKG